MTFHSRVLVVEDDEDTRANLCDILELDGHLTQPASSAAEAYQWIERELFDIVLLDRKLPDGWAEGVLGELRRRSPSTQTIVITGFADMDSTIEAMRNGAVDYILKPVNPAALRASIQRIVERRRMELAYRQEQQFADKVWRTAEAIVLVLDLDGTVQRVNPYLTKISGWEVDEVVHENWFEKCIPKDQYGRVVEIWTRTAQGVETQGIINPILTRDGQRRQIRWSNTTLKDDDGKTVAVLAIGVDVTDSLLAQERALQSERLAAIGQTMTALAHESRNALQRIQAKADVLGLELEDSPQGTRDVNSIKRAAKDLTILLEEVRAFAAPIHLNRERVNLGKVISRAWEYAQPMSVDSPARLAVTDAIEQTSLRIDASRMERVFRNLFENAIAACQAPASINVSGQASGEMLEIAVEDNGSGVAVQVRDTVFDAFVTTKDTGTGLGMAIVKRAVEAHGGSIALDCSCTTGARFIIQLPITL